LYELNLSLVEIYHPGFFWQHPNFLKIICSGTHKRPIGVRSWLEARTTKPINLQIRDAPFFLVLARFISKLGKNL
jgi:hypothetical protein